MSAIVSQAVSPEASPTISSIWALGRKVQYNQGVYCARRAPAVRTTRTVPRKIRRRCDMLASPSRAECQAPSGQEAGQRSILGVDLDPLANISQKIYSEYGGGSNSG